MASDRQLAANRANAQKSTGPSKEGRRRTAKNALRHGLSLRGLSASLSMRAETLAHAISDDEPQTPLAIRHALAEALERREKVRQAREQMIETALQEIDPTLPPEVRLDLAYQAVAPRLTPLAEYEYRAAAAVRKQLRKL